MNNQYGSVGGDDPEKISTPTERHDTLLRELHNSLDQLEIVLNKVLLPKPQAEKIPNDKDVLIASPPAPRSDLFNWVNYSSETLSDAIEKIERLRDRIDLVF